MRVSISLVLHSPMVNKYFTSQHRPIQITYSRWSGNWSRGCDLGIKGILRLFHFPFCFNLNEIELFVSISLSKCFVFTQSTKNSTKSNFQLMFHFPFRFNYTFDFELHHKIEFFTFKFVLFLLSRVKINEIKLLSHGFPPLATNKIFRRICEEKKLKITAAAPYVQFEVYKMLFYEYFFFKLYP